MIEIMNKIETIEKISRENLEKAFVRLLQAMEFRDIHIYDAYITATEDSKLSAISRTFVIINEHISGDIDTGNIETNIHDAHKNTSGDIITLVSNFHISNGQKQLLASKFQNIVLQYISRDELINLFDKYDGDFWKHDDVALLNYEHKFIQNLDKENQLKLLHLPTDKYKKLLSIFIQPSLIKNEEDPLTHTYMRKRVNMDDLIHGKKCCLISGISGAGKSTLLQNLGIKLIENNSNEGEISKRNIPIYITSTDILASLRNIEEAIKKKISEDFSEIKLAELQKQYNVVILIDSIDEFDEEDKARIIKKLTNLYKDKNIRFFIGTRELDASKEYIDDSIIESLSLNRFNIEQIRRFVSAFLPNEEKINDLMESLRENKILERLPITPLTLSLISILYDENDYEVPATITDVYKNFNDLIIGRDIVSTKIEFVDISFRERILSIYAYELMQRENHKPMSREEFIEFFSKFYEGKSLPIKNADLKDVLEYLLHNTGILYIKEHKWVCFSHDSYMEYYTAVEIFNFHRNQEKVLVDNFFDVMWQNVAIFYAGMTKDMEGFAKEINNKLMTASKIMELISGVQGAGYLLQALYQTNNNIRKDVVLTSLEMVLETNQFFKKMTTVNSTMLKNYSMPIVQIINFLHFYEMFNSLTLKAPLQMAFKELTEELDNLISKGNLQRLPAVGYKLMELGFTLDSTRINDNSGIDYIINKSELLRDPNLNMLANLCVDFLGKSKYKDLKTEVKREAEKMIPVLRKITGDPTGKIRFSVLDTIQPERKVRIFVEGKTDAEILEHAYMVLTGGKAPYWNIKMATKNGTTGSASSVSSTLEASINFLEPDECIIGIYDHDKAGLSEYRRLSRDYEEISTDSIKKRKGYDSYLLCIPIPGEMSQYLQVKQDFNFFEIEHYFGHDYLKNHQMIKDQEVLPGIFEIRDNPKTSFSSEITKEDDPKIFKYFVDLFRKIDQITHNNINYITE